MQHLIPFLFATALASAQIVSVGVKAGVPVTDAVPSYGNESSRMVDTGRWTVGPTAEIKIRYGFSIEVDALYRGYRLQESYASRQLIIDGNTYLPYYGSYRSDNRAWDFPVLLKYRIGSRPLRPFITAGYQWTRVTSDSTASYICLGTTEACAASQSALYYGVGHISYTNNYDGITAGLGVEYKWKRVTLAPEARYSNASNPTKNRVSILMGFTF